MPDRQIRVPRFSGEPERETAAPEEAADEYQALMIAAGALAVLGWGGLALVVNLALPTLGPRWLFFALWFMALAGTAAPFVRYLHRRFARADAPPAPPGMILRQSIWVGLYGASCAWLQIGRALTLPLAFLLAAAMGAVEWFIRVRERSKWNPQ